MKIPKLMQTILLSVGVSAICTFFASLLISKIRTAEFFQAMILGTIFVGISGYLFFEKKIISPNIWVRRFLSIEIDVLLMSVSMMIFGVISPTAERFLWFFRTALFFAIVIGIPVFLFADYAEKNHLDKINQKLGKNE